MRTTKNKTKKLKKVVIKVPTNITLRNGNKIDIISGDIIYVTISPDDDSVLVRGRFIEKINKTIKLYVLNPSLELQEVTVRENQLVRMEKPN